MIINQFREYLIDKTIGALFVDGKPFGETLEDCGRPTGVKIQDETCIPEMVLRVAITRSGRFKKDMMILYNVEEDHSIEYEGVRYTGIRVHRGITIAHTAGCVLLPGYEDLQAKVKEAFDLGEDVFWVINKMDIK